MFPDGEFRNYRSLDPAALATVLAAIPTIAARLGGSPATWAVAALAGGNLNNIFAVRGPTGSVCTKQSLPYMRLLGQDAPMPLNRIIFEQRTLAEHARHAPRRMPQVYHFDRDLCLVVMEYLAPHVELRQALIDGYPLPHVAGHLGDYIAHVLFNTSDLALPSATRRSQAASMAGNAGMYKFIEDLTFVEPYMLHPRNAWNAPYLDDVAALIRDDAALKPAVGRLKRRYMTAGEALLHGDLHTGSVMVSDGDTRIIDFELSAYGPMGYDLGILFGHFLLNYFGQDGSEDPGREARQTSALTMIEQVWARFCSTFTGLWQSARTGDAYPADWFDRQTGTAAQDTALTALLVDVFADALGFAGTEMIRRILNLGQVADLQSIADPERRAPCERRAVLFARDLILGAHSLHQITQVTAAAQQARTTA